jgi:hypothetical protein
VECIYFIFPVSINTIAFVTAFKTIRLSAAVSQITYEVAAGCQRSFYMALAIRQPWRYLLFTTEGSTEALPLVEADYLSATVREKKAARSNAAMILVAIYIKKGQTDSAQKYMDLSRPFIYGTGAAVLLRKLV